MLKKYILKTLKNQVEFYKKEYKMAKETKENVYENLNINDDKLKEQLHESINRLIGIKNYPDKYCLDIGVAEINKLIKNLLALKIKYR